MNCPGSNVLLNQLQLPATDEEEYQINGSAAHEAAAECVMEKKDAWEVVGQKFYKETEITPDMADAIQVYLDYVRDKRDQWYCEFAISGDLHPLFYGTVDYANIKDGLLEIVDFKFGQGIVVEPYRNTQLMYYAYGLLNYQPAVRRVKCTIVQPRAYHEEGPVRSWEIPGGAEELAEWGEKVLIPAMLNAEMDETLEAGPWCRFCPAKLACPLLAGLFKAAALINPKIIPNFSDEALARDYAYRDAVKFYMKALDDEAFRRLSTGRKLSTAKLVNKRADRVFQAQQVIDDKTVTVQEAFAQFGKEVFTTPVFKTPAQMEKINPAAAALVKQWAYMPSTGFTVAPIDDRRVAVTMQSTEEAFGAAIAKLKESGEL